MLRQGCYSLSVDCSGRVLDRLVGLEQVIPAEAVREAIRISGQNNGRGPLTSEVMMWVILAMGVLTDVPIRQVFKHARRLRPEEPSPGRSALCQARRRLGVQPIRHLFEAVVRPLATPDGVPTAFFNCLRWMGFDGTVLDVPDTPSNVAAFGRPSGGDRGDGAFPQVRKLSLIELGTHVETAFAHAGINDCSEAALAEQLFDDVPADALLLLDRGFFSYEFWQKLGCHAIRVLARVNSKLILRPIQSLSDGSYLAKIYPRNYDRRLERHGIVLRVIRYTHNDPHRVGFQEEHRLITNLLDPQQYPAEQLISGYHERWEEELVFDEQKTHHDPRRVAKPTHLRSQTPMGVEQELYALSLGHFTVRALMTEASIRNNVDPDRLSYTGCLHILRCRLPECDARTSHDCPSWLNAVLAEMARERIEPRRNRVNPRVIKRKISKWPKKRRHHLRPPPLAKAFMRTVVMIR